MSISFLFFFFLFDSPSMFRLRWNVFVELIETGGWELNLCVWNKLIEWIENPLEEIMWGVLFYLLESLCNCMVEDYIEEVEECDDYLCLMVLMWILYRIPTQEFVLKYKNYFTINWWHFMLDLRLNFCLLIEGNKFCVDIFSKPQKCLI